MDGRLRFTAGTHMEARERYDADTEEFIAAVRDYQLENDRKFPAFSEILAVAKALGYRKVAAPGPPPTY